MMQLNDLKPNPGSKQIKNVLAVAMPQVLARQPDVEQKDKTPVVVVAFVYITRVATSRFTENCLSCAVRDSLRSTGLNIP